jgi:hypothetical protein
MKKYIVLGVVAMLSQTGCALDQVATWGAWLDAVGAFVQTVVWAKDIVL